jgi:hypothetical protein
MVHVAHTAMNCIILTRSCGRLLLIFIYSTRSEDDHTARCQPILAAAEQKVQEIGPQISIAVVDDFQRKFV